MHKGTKLSMREVYFGWLNVCLQYRHMLHRSAVVEDGIRSRSAARARYNKAPACCDRVQRQPVMTPQRH